MPKCLACGDPLPAGVKYCPAKKLIEYGRVCGFRGCYPIRADALRMPKGGRRIAPKFRTDAQLEMMEHSKQGGI